MRNIASNVRWQQTNSTVVHITEEPHLATAQPLRGWVDYSYVALYNTFKTNEKTKQQQIYKTVRPWKSSLPSTIF